MNAVLWAEDKGASISIHSTSMMVSELPLGLFEAKTSLTHEYVKFIKPHLDWISFNKVNAQAGVEGHKIAVKLAKKAVACQKEIC